MMGYQDYSSISGGREGRLQRRGSHTKSSSGYALLCDALKNNRVAAAKLLLTSGTDVNRKNKKPRDTPLHLAVINDDIKIIMMILDKGANINATNQHGQTPLYIACEHEKMDVAKLLLKHGADANVRDNNGEGILRFAANNKIKCFPIIDHLLEYVAKIDDRDKDEAILEYGLVIKPEDAYNSDFLHATVKRGYSKIVEDLLRHGANVNMLNDSSFKDYTLLHSAADNKQAEVAKLLINYGADVNAQDEIGRTPIFYAIENADFKMTKLLLTRGANVKSQTKKGWTMLHVATRRRYSKGVEVLLEYHADVNSVGRDNITPLMLSAQVGDEEISTMLLNKGANVNAKQNDKWQALHIASEKGHGEVVKVLLKHGAKVDSQISCGNTPLHLCAAEGHYEIVQTILKFGADIDRRNKYGRTALHTASRGGHPIVVAILLEHGSDINITTTNGATPLYLALATAQHHYYTDYDRAIIELLKGYIVRLKTANLYVSEQNLQLMSRICGIIYLQDACEKEIADMKRDINNTHLSFYDILAKSTNSLEICMRNKNVVQALKTVNYKSNFPMYAGLIESRFRKIVKRKKLLERGNNICNFLFNDFPELPYDCTEKIFSYLSDEDLRTLIDACKPRSISNSNTNIIT